MKGSSHQSTASQYMCQAVVNLVGWIAIAAARQSLPKRNCLPTANWDCHWLRVRTTKSSGCGYSRHEKPACGHCNKQNTSCVTAMLRFHIIMYNYPYLTYRYISYINVSLPCILPYKSHKWSDLNDNIDNDRRVVGNAE